MNPIEKKQMGNLFVEVHANRLSAGQAAGYAAAEELKRVLTRKGKARMVFAAAPSQNEMLETLVAVPDIEWNKVTAFHMDEYLGLPDNAPQLFAYYLRRHLFDLVSFAAVHLMQGTDPESICRDYSRKLKEETIDIVCMGVGENGHIAFNDPPVANFSDPEMVKIVQLDDACRQQQVNDGCFPNFDSVPKQAITLTVPALMSGTCLICTVPGKRKGMAVRQLLFEKISTECPASILRTHNHCTLYLDHDCWSVSEETIES